jgi:hypothetical protein
VIVRNVGDPVAALPALYSLTQSDGLLATAGYNVVLHVSNQLGAVRFEVCEVVFNYAVIRSGKQDISFQQTLVIQLSQLQ